MKFFLPFFFLFVASPALAMTDVLLNDPARTASYKIVLTYDDVKHTLSSSNSTTSAYRVVRKLFAPEKTLFESEFLGILIGPNEKEYQRFGIPLPGKVMTGEKVVYEVPAPYVPTGERIDIYRGATKLFSIDVSASRLCRQDGMCRSDVGENIQNCPSDCALVAPPPPPPSIHPEPPEPVVTPGALPPEGGEGPDISGGEEPSHLLFPLVFFFLGLASFGVWMYLRKRDRSS